MASTLVINNYVPQAPGWPTGQTGRELWSWALQIVTWASANGLPSALVFPATGVPLYHIPGVVVGFSVASVNSKRVKVSFGLFSTGSSTRIQERFRAYVGADKNAQTNWGINPVNKSAEFSGAAAVATYSTRASFDVLAVSGSYPTLILGHSGARNCVVGVFLENGRGFYSPTFGFST